MIVSIVCRPAGILHSLLRCKLLTSMSTFDYTAPTVVTIVSSPAGAPVSGSNNTFDYPILIKVFLTCMVEPTPSSSVTYQWNTTGCYTNSKFTRTNPQCFPHGKTKQTVAGNILKAEDAGTITCTVTINGSDYTSEPFTLRISGEQLVYCVIACIVYCKQCMLLLLAICTVVLYTSCYGLCIEVYSL